MIDTERLILSPKRRRKYFEAVGVSLILTALGVSGVIYALIKEEMNPVLPLVILIPLSLSVYTYYHQSSRLRFKKIETPLSKSLNYKYAKTAVEELGWLVTSEDNGYLEATIHSQLIVILSVDHKILITSISRPDHDPVQAGWSFGKHERNVAQFTEIFQAVQASGA